MWAACFFDVHEIETEDKRTVPLSCWRQGDGRQGDGSSVLLFEDKETKGRFLCLAILYFLCYTLHEVMIMPRNKRELSQSGIYHVMIRGINQQQIFHEAEDCKKFLSVLKSCKEKSKFKLFAYCFMGNHLHLLLQETEEPIGLIMKRIGSKYVFWYNNKYQRTGHLFQDRFKSEAVEDDEYFLSVLRYIHNNPVKAGLVKQVQDYCFSSYNAYMKNDTIIDTAFLWSIIQPKQFDELHHKANYYEHIDVDEQKSKLFDAQAQEIIKKYTGCTNVEEYQKLDYPIQLEKIAFLKKEGLSIRQISRLTGLSKGIVERH